MPSMPNPLTVCDFSEGLRKRHSWGLLLSIRFASQHYEDGVTGETLDRSPGR